MSRTTPDPDLATLHNLRDLGGTPGADGHVVRRGRLFRGGTPAFLDDAATTVLLASTGLRTRVDLRSAREHHDETSESLRRREAVVRHLELHAGPSSWDLDESHRAEWVGSHYLAYLDASGREIAEILRVLADPASYPVLLHCTAGKDRTGVAVALVLGVLGTPEPHVVADYARSADAVGELRALLTRLPRYRERIAELPQEALTTMPTSMEVFLAGVRERYDGVPAYLQSVGVSDGELAAVRENLLA